MSFKLMLATAFGATVIAGTAFAADLPQRSPPPMFTPVSAYNWTGLYVGANAGYGWGNQNPLGLIAPQFSQNNSFSMSGGLFGGTIGGQLQVAHVVLGIEADGAWADIGGSATANIAALPGTSLRLHSQDDSFFTARSRVGYALDNWLLYTTFGVAAFEGASRGSVLSGATTCGSLSLPNCANSQFRPGVTAGLGVEYGFTPNWSAKVEYLWAGAVAGASTDSLSIIRAGLNYRFGG
jgi:outer membrane immunogenic protein